MDIREVTAMGGKSTLKRHGIAHFKKMGLLSVKRRFANMTKEQISDYFRRVQKGLKEKKS